MNTVDQMSPDSDQAQSPMEDAQYSLSSQEAEESEPSHATRGSSSALDEPENMEFVPPKISGFDGGTRHILKEPSLYLSLAIVLVATSVCLFKTPVLFWPSLTIMSLLTIVFHVVAERCIFRSKKEFSAFSAPFEGVFVVTFGSIIPGLALFAYGAYALATDHHANFLEEIGKLVLLLVVPLFNFAVWSTVRRGYLVRPRLVGLMSGFTLGLSACWTMIWVKTALVHTDVSCKFGWMLLLCSSPFLLFSAICLSRDLWQKTESNIRQIVTTFSILGCLLSFFFVCTPLIRGFYVESMLSTARNSAGPAKMQAVTALRTLASDEDLQPSKHPIGGFALGALLIPERGLKAFSDWDRDLYFQITGKSFYESEKAEADKKKAKEKSESKENVKAASGKQETVCNADAREEEELEEEKIPVNPIVGGKTPGISLPKSQISGNIDAASLTSTIDWTLTVHNSLSSTEEGRAEFGLPKGAVVSRVTLWVNGEPMEAAFAPPAVSQAVYDSIVQAKRDPLLVTMSGPDRVLVRCFPIRPGSDMKFRLGFKVPLETTDGKVCSMQLPRLLSSNFSQPKRHRVNLVSHDKPVNDIKGFLEIQNGSVYNLTGLLKTSNSNKAIATIAVRRTGLEAPLAARDWYAREPRYIVQSLQEVIAKAPKRLFVVVDTSAALRPETEAIKKAIKNIPAHFHANFYFANAREIDTKERLDVAESETQPQITALTQAEAQEQIAPELFVGGVDNGPTLREVIELASEEVGSGVLWIHGPQPLAHRTWETTALDLIHHVQLIDMPAVSGDNSILHAVLSEDSANQITRESIKHESIEKDMTKLISGWEKGVKTLELRRWVSQKKPAVAIVSDPQVAAQMTCLWAKSEMERLMLIGQDGQAAKLAKAYRLITPVTGAVVLESDQEYAANHLNPGDFVSGSTSNSWQGLVGAPVDPRYGQSNDVGQLADFGYDKARDIARVATAMSAFVSMFVALIYLRRRRSITNKDMVKAGLLVLAVPMTLHFISVFAINNFGGLGGGL